MTRCQLWGSAVFNLGEMVRGPQSQINHCTLNMAAQVTTREGLQGREYGDNRGKNGGKVNLGNQFGRSDTDWVKVEVELRSVPSAGICVLAVKQHAPQNITQFPLICLTQM